MKLGVTDNQSLFLVSDTAYRFSINPSILTFQGLIRQLDSAEINLENCNSAGENLEIMLKQCNSPYNEIHERTHRLNSLFRKLQVKLTDSLSDVEEVTAQAEEFVEIITVFNAWMTKLELEVNTRLKKSPGRDVAELRLLISEIEASIVLSHLRRSATMEIIFVNKFSDFYDRRRN